MTQKMADTVLQLLDALLANLQSKVTARAQGALGSCKRAAGVSNLFCSCNPLLASSLGCVVDQHGCCPGSLGRAAGTNAGDHVGNNTATQQDPWCEACCCCCQCCCCCIHTMSTTFASWSWVEAACMQYGSCICKLTLMLKLMLMLMQLQLPRTYLAHHELESAGIRSWSWPMHMQYCRPGRTRTRRCRPCS